MATSTAAANWLQRLDSDSRWLLAALATCAMLLVMTVSSAGVLAYVTTQDIWYTFDTIWRAENGQIPHRDFHSPVGQGFNWPFQILALFGDVDIRTLLQADALVGAFIALLGAFALRQRLKGPLLFVVLLLLVTTAITPRQIGRDAEILSHLALYNRWGWSLLCLTGLICVLPPRGGDARRDDIITGAIVGAVIAYLLLLKITYFAGAAGLLALGVLVRTTRLRLALVSVTAAALVLVITEGIYRNLGAYWADIRTAIEVAVSGDPLRVAKLKAHLGEAIAVGVIIAAVLFLAAPTLNPLAYMRRWWRELTLGAAMTGGCALIALQNHSWSEGPLYLAAIAASAEMAARRRVQLSGNWAPLARPLRLALTFAPVVSFTGVDSYSIALHAALTHSDRACRLTALAGTRGENLMFPPHAFTADMRAAGVTARCAARDAVALRRYEYDYVRLDVERLHDGITLLRAHAQPGDVVWAIDFANPFSALTGAAPPRGVQMWWDPGRTFSESTHPDGDQLLNEVDWIVVPRPATLLDYTAAPMLRVYGEEITARFEPAFYGAFWQLWRAKPAPTTSLPIDFDYDARAGPDAPMNARLDMREVALDEGDVNDPPAPAR